MFLVLQSKDQYIILSLCLLQLVCSTNHCFVSSNFLSDCSLLSNSDIFRHIASLMLTNLIQILQFLSVFHQYNNLPSLSSYVISSSIFWTMLWLAGGSGFASYSGQIAPLAPTCIRNRSTFARHHSLVVVFMNVFWWTHWYCVRKCQCPYTFFQQYGNVCVL